MVDVQLDVKVKSRHDFVIIVRKLRYSRKLKLLEFSVLLLLNVINFLILPKISEILYREFSTHILNVKV